MYDAIDWPVITLLAALIPVAGAMASTGAANVIANGLLTGLTGGSPVVALVLILVVTPGVRQGFLRHSAAANA
jgi:di/tricarboxylate transporter